MRTFMEKVTLHVTMRKRYRKSLCKNMPKHIQNMETIGELKSRIKQRNQFKMRRCTLQCGNDTGKNYAKTYQTNTQIEPKLELKSRKLEKHMLKMRRRTLQCEIDMGKIDAKTCQLKSSNKNKTNPLNMRRCTLQCESDVGKFCKKHLTNIHKLSRKGSKQ